MRAGMVRGNGVDGSARAHVARGIRVLCAFAVATGIGAWLTLAQLSHPTDLGHEVGPPVSIGWFLVVAGLGVAGLVALAGWHALWLAPAGTAVFSEVYARWFWEKVPGVGTSMDYIQYDPRAGLFAMVLVVPFAALLALLRWDVFRRQGGAR